MTDKLTKQHEDLKLGANALLESRLDILERNIQSDKSVPLTVIIDCAADYLEARHKNPIMRYINPSPYDVRYKAIISKLEIRK